MASEKTPCTMRNFAGGVDLLAERDSGNTVRILTGKPEYSLPFWRKLAILAKNAIKTMKEEADAED